MNFNPGFTATAIGSMPHTDPKVATNEIMDTILEIPHWPQLPNTDFREQMEIQFCEGMPCVVIDEAKQRMYFDTSGDITGELEIFYQNYLYFLK